MQGVQSITRSLGGIGVIIPSFRCCIEYAISMDMPQVQIVRSLGRVDGKQRGAGALLNLHARVANGIACEDRRRAFVDEALDHAENVKQDVRYVAAQTCARQQM